MENVNQDRQLIKNSFRITLGFSIDPKALFVDLQYYTSKNLFTSK